MSAALAFAAVCALATGAFATGVAAQDAVPVAHDPPEWRWQQVLASPRIGGRLSAIAVDTRNPNRIFVGTDEYTIVRSLDGGVTWRELELSPFVVQARNIVPRSPGLPRLGEETREDFSYFIDPPFRPRPVDRIGLSGFEIVHFDAWPEFIAAGVFFGEDPPGDTLLFDAATRRRTYPVVRIAICPSTPFPLIVATSTEVLGSADDGVTFVRLLRVPGGVSIHHVICSPTDPQHVLVASGFGMFRSRDGGVTFDQDMSGWPGRAATGIAFDPRSGHVHVATGHVLFSGDADSEVGLEMVYPDFNNAETAPWTTINWIDVGDREVWLATDDGLRASSDGGRRWRPVAPNLLSRQVLTQVVSGPNERGGQRVAVMARDCPLPATRDRRRICRDGVIYSSDDGGETWAPFFIGLSRRGLRQIAAAPAVSGVPPRWWVVTGGEVWATVPAQDSGLSVDRQSQLWALERIRSSAGVRETVEGTLDATHLSRPEIDRALGSLRRSNFLPRLNLRFSFESNAYARLESIRPIPTADIAEGTDGTNFAIELFATWDLGQTLQVHEELSPTQNALYELRRQVSFIAEDAWHERMEHLRRIAAGMSDRLQIEILKERIAALEVVLSTWLRPPPAGDGARRTR